LACGITVLAGLLAVTGELQAQQDSAAVRQDTTVQDTTRIDPLRNNVLDKTGRDLAADPFERSWELFGTGARMAIRGYIKLDYIQDFSGAYDRFQFPVSQIPVPGDGRPEQSGYMNLFARESRINFDGFSWRSISGTCPTPPSSRHRGCGTSMECTVLCWPGEPGGR